MRRGERRDDRERGAILVVLSLMVVPIAMMTAVVVDLGAVRWQRATVQNTADAAAVAAATQLSPSGSGVANDGLPRSACTQALASVRQNAPGFTATDTTSAGGCASLPALVSACQASPPAFSSSVTSGGYTVTITYPLAAATDADAAAAQRVEYVRATGFAGDTTSVDARCHAMVVTVQRLDIGPYFAGIFSSSGKSVSETTIGFTTGTG